MPPPPRVRRVVTRTNGPGHQVTSQAGSGVWHRERGPCPLEDDEPEHEPPRALAQSSHPPPLAAQLEPHTSASPSDPGLSARFVEGVCISHISASKDS